MEYTYDAWGKVLSVTGTLASTLGQDNPFRYRGYYYDTETGFYYLQTRYYDPEVGRFLNADVIIGANGDIPGYNMFAYCSNNPVVGFDPSGQFWIAALFTTAFLAVCMGTLSSCSEQPEIVDPDDIPWDQRFYSFDAALLAASERAQNAYLVDKYEHECQVIRRDEEDGTYFYHITEAYSSNLNGKVEFRSGYANYSRGDKVVAAVHTHPSYHGHGSDGDINCAFYNKVYGANDGHEIFFTEPIYRYNYDGTTVLDRWVIFHLKSNGEVKEWTANCDLMASGSTGFLRIALSL